VPSDLGGHVLFNYACAAVMRDKGGLNWPATWRIPRRPLRSNPLLALQQNRLKYLDKIWPNAVLTFINDNKDIDIFFRNEVWLTQENASSD